MDEERKSPDPLALSEAPQCAGQEDPAVLQDDMVLSAQGEGLQTEPEGADGVTDFALSGEEVVEPEIEPRLPLRSGAGRGRRLVRKEDQARVVPTGAQRLLILDTWQRSGLPAGDFAPLVGISKHTLYAWKKQFDAAWSGRADGEAAGGDDGEQAAGGHQADDPDAQAVASGVGLPADQR